MWLRAATSSSASDASPSPRQTLCIQQISQAGMGIALTSADLDEIRGPTTRVLVLAGGRLTAQFDADTATEADIAAAASAYVETRKAGEPCQTQMVQ